LIFHNKNEYVHLNFIHLLKSKNKDAKGKILARSININDNSLLSNQGNYIDLNNIYLYSSQSILLELDININDIHLNKLKLLNTLQYEQHDGIVCDGICNKKNFVGLCFKCDDCPHYNLCETCALNKHVCTKMHKRDHPIILTSNRVIPKIDPDDIEIGEVLGRGAFGKSKY